VVRESNHPLIGPPVATLHGWRRELFGEAAISLKHGPLALAIERGRVIRVERNKVEADTDSAVSGRRAE
jgi:hypothetical protein